jgi:hypothetical protein
MADKKREGTGSLVAHSRGRKLHLETNEGSCVDTSRIAFLLA